MALQHWRDARASRLCSSVWEVSSEGRERRHAEGDDSRVACRLGVGAIAIASVKRRARDGLRIACRARPGASSRDPTTCAGAHSVSPRCVADIRYKRTVRARAVAIQITVQATGRAGYHTLCGDCSAHTLASCVVRCPFTVALKERTERKTRGRGTGAPRGTDLTVYDRLLRIFLSLYYVLTTLGGPVGKIGHVRTPEL